jgi:hypothetical protein
MVTDKEAEEALHYLNDSAEKTANSRATRIYMEEYRKSLKALLMRNFLHLPVSAQEREAYASEEYINHLKALRIAIQNDEKARFLRASNEAKIEAWRTFQANNRVKI